MELTPTPKWYRGADIPLALIEDFAAEVAKQFAPDRIILFGSYAYGDPHQDSDVDLLVIMPAANELHQAVKITRTVDHNFPLDLIVRTPANMKWRLADGDPLLSEAIKRGRVLYEKTDAGVGAESRTGHSRRAEARSKPTSRK